MSINSRENRFTKRVLHFALAALAVLLVCGVFCGAAGAAGVSVTTEQGLKDAVAAGGEVILNDDISLSASLNIIKDVTLDLNGHVLSLQSGKSGSVITVSAATGNLTLTDANTASKTYKFTKKSDGLYELNNAGTISLSGGVITGGKGTMGTNHELCGGGVYVANGGRFTMSGGNIVGNTAYYGGGVSVEGSGSKFTMSEGTIVGNTAILTGNPGGGGVHVADSAVFTMSGSAVIKENTAKWGGGVQLSSSGKFIMEGGEISGNKANGGDGGGINTDSAIVFTMSGGIISDNTASSKGGGMRVGDGGTFNVSGTAVIKDNMQNSAPNNVCFLSTSYLSLIGKFTGEVYINSVNGIDPDFECVFGTDQSADLGAGCFKSDKQIPSTTYPYVGKLSGTNLVWADANYEVYNGNTYVSRYYTLQEAYDAASTLDGYTIKVLKGVTETSQQTLSGEKSVLLDLNGHSITAGTSESYTDALIKWDSSGKTLTITDRSSGDAGTLNGVSTTRVLNINAGTVVMNKGTITGGKADNGGGVYVADGAVFSISGTAAVKENTATSSGGGVYVASGAAFSISGSPIIKDNTKGSAANNVCLTNAAQLHLTGAFTGRVYINSPAGADNSQFGLADGDYAGAANFISENKKIDDVSFWTGKIVNDEGGQLKLIWDPGDVNYEVYSDYSEGSYSGYVGGYTALSNAYSVAVDGARNNYFIVVVAKGGIAEDNTEAAMNVADKTVTLDLNGKVIKGNGANPVIKLSAGTLNLIDNSAQQPHYFNVTENVYTWELYDASNDEKAKAIPIEFIRSDMKYNKPGERTPTDLAKGDIIRVTGGCITGGAGAVNVTGGEFTMTAGNIVGNKVTGGKNGGGVYVASGALFKVSGSPVIKGNAKDSAANNVWLFDAERLQLTSALTQAAEIHITSPVRTLGEGEAKPFGKIISPYLATETDAGRFVADTTNPVQAAEIKPGDNSILQWEPAEFIIIVNQPEGGTIAVSSNPAKVGKTVNLTKTPDQYYKFHEWSVTADDNPVTVTDDTFIMVSGNVIVTAKFARKTVTVTFDKNGGDTGANPPSIDEKAGRTYQLPETRPTWKGYTFNGWWTNQTDGDKVTESTVVTNTTAHSLYAHWTPNHYTVHFDANGGEGTMADQSFTYDEEQNLRPNTFTKEDRKFAGWAETSGGKAMYADKASVMNLASTDGDAVTLYAFWTDKDYLVTFDVQGHGTAPAPQPADYGEKVTRPDNPTAAGWTFGGWYKDAACDKIKIWDFDKDIVTESITLYAYWTKNPQPIPPEPPSSRNDGYSVWLQEAPVSGAQITQDITYQYMGSLFIGVSSADIPTLRTISPDLASLAEIKFDAAQKAGIRITNNKGAPALIPAHRTIDELDDLSFAKVCDIKSANPDEKLTQVTISIPQASVTAAGLTKDDVTIYHYIENFDIWVPLDNLQIAEDGTNYIYTAATDGASPFGVLIKKFDLIKPQPIPTKTASSPLPVIGLFAGLGAALLVMRRK